MTEQPQPVVLDGQVRHAPSWAIERGFGPWDGLSNAERERRTGAPIPNGMGGYPFLGAGGG